MVPVRSHARESHPVQDRPVWSPPVLDVPDQSRPLGFIFEDSGALRACRAGIHTQAGVSIRFALVLAQDGENRTAPKLDYLLTSHAPPCALSLVVGEEQR